MIQIFAFFPKWPGGEIMHYLIPPIAIKPLSRPKTSWASKTSNVPTSIPSSRVRPPTTTSRCPSPPQSSWTWTVSISLGLKPRTSAFFLSLIRTIVRQYNISVPVSTSVKLDMNCKQESLFFPRPLLYLQGLSWEHLFSFRCTLVRLYNEKSDLLLLFPPIRRQLWRWEFRAVLWLVEIIFVVRWQDGKKVNVQGFSFI